MESKTERLTLNVTEVAAHLGLSRNATYLAIKNGQIPSVKIGKRLLIPKIQFEKILNGTEGAKRDEGVIHDR